jgi:hypothetical protein
MNRVSWAALALWAVSFGCEPADIEGEPLERATGSCVPNQVFRCLCGLDEGTQSCAEDGTVTACSCRAQSRDALGASRTAAQLETCGGEPVDVGGSFADSEGSLASAALDVGLSCLPAATRDQVWALRALEPGTVEVEVAAAFPGGISARVGACTSAAAERTCSPRFEKLSIRGMRAGEVVHVVVAALAEGGPYTLTSRIVP